MIEHVDHRPQHARRQVAHRPGLVPQTFHVLAPLVQVLVVIRLACRGEPPSSCAVRPPDALRERVEPGGRPPSLELAERRREVIDGQARVGADVGRVAWRAAVCRLHSAHRSTGVASAAVGERVEGCRQRVGIAERCDGSACVAHGDVEPLGAVCSRVRPAAGRAPEPPCSVCAPRAPRRRRQCRMSRRRTRRAPRSHPPATIGRSCARPRPGDDGDAHDAPWRNHLSRRSYPRDAAADAGSPVAASAGHTSGHAHVPQGRDRAHPSSERAARSRHGPGRLRTCVARADRPASDRCDRGRVGHGVGRATATRSSSRAHANPETVNPSLWRQAQLNNIHGLFEVAPGCWQARGYDISNITFIAGDDRLDRDRPAHGRGMRPRLPRARQRAPRRASGGRR